MSTPASVRTMLRYRTFTALAVLGVISWGWAQESPPPLATYKGHTNAIYTVLISPDGKTIFTGSFDNTAKMWDATTGKSLRDFAGPQGHQSLVLSMALTPKGDALATGGADNSAKVWDIPVNSPVREFTAAAGVQAIAATPDGKSIAAACADGSVKWWTTADNKLVTAASLHPSGATGIALSSNGQLIASSGTDGTVRFWNGADGKLLGEVGAHASAATGITLHPNGTAAYSIGADGYVKFWQLPPQPTRPLPPHGDAISALLVRPDGGAVFTGAMDKSLKQSQFVNGQLIREYANAPGPIQTIATGGNPNVVAIGTTDGKIAFWNSADGKPLPQLPAHSGAVLGINFAASQAAFTTAGADGAIKTWQYPINAAKSIVTPDRVLAQLLSPDGKRLFTAGADKVARSWQYPAGTAERQFTGHTGAVTALAVTADGASFITASSDETIRFWNVANGMETARLSGHVGPIHSLSLAGNLLVSGGEDGTVKIWQLPLSPAKPFAHPDAVSAMVLSADGNKALTIANDKQARLWNLTTGQVERAFTAAGGPIAAIAIANDNATVAIAGADKSLVINRAGTEIKKIPALPGVASALAFSPDGSKIAIALSDNTIRLFNVIEAKEVKEPKELKSIPGHTATITALAYTPKGDLLVSASADKTARFWNAADGVVKGQVTHPAAISSLSISKDGSRLALGGSDKSVSLWTLADSKPAGTIATPAEVRGISFNPDATKFAVAGADAKVRVYSMEGKLLEFFSHDAAATSVAYLPDGKRILSASADKTIRISATALVAQATQVGAVRQVFITPQGDRIFSAGDDKQIHIRDAKTAKEMKAIPAHDGSIAGFSISGDLSKIATASADKTAKIWTVADGKLLATIPLPGPVQSVALAPNGLRLALAFADPAQRIRAYDLLGRELQAISDPLSPVRCMNFLNDNRTLLAGGDDKTITIADVAVQSVFSASPTGLTAVALHPNGLSLIAAGKDKSIKLWDIAQAKELKALPNLGENITALASSRDFTAFVAASGKLVKVWQVADGKELANLPHPAEVVSLAFNSDRSRVITGSNDNLARVWEVATGKLLQTVRHAGSVRAVAFHPNEQSVVTASADKTAATQVLVFQRSIEASKLPLRTIAITANGSHLLTAGDDKLFKAWNLGNGTAEKSFEGADGAIQAVAVSRNSQLVASGGVEKIVRLYNFADAKLIGTIVAPAPIRGLAFHPTLPILSATCEDKSVQVWNIAFQPGQPLPPEFGKAIQAFTHNDIATGVQFGETAPFPLYSGSLDKTIEQWRIASDAPTRNFAHPNLVDIVAFDGTGKLLATGCHDGNLRIFDIEKNAAIKTVVAHVQMQPQQIQNPIYCLAWTPDNKQIITGSYDKSLKLWDASAGTLVREFKGYDEKTFPKGHRDQIFSVVFSKDGKNIVTASSDRSIKLWNVADGSVAREFVNPGIKQGDPKLDSPAAHPGWIYAVKYSPDETKLISVGAAPKNQGYLAVWNVADGKLLSATTLPFGPIFSVAISKDGSELLLGCGPRERANPLSEAIRIKMPGK